MKILIDNGHGQFTPGKRSPDGNFREAFYNREIARRIVADLIDRGRDAELLVPEDDDISLKERVRRVNAACLLRGRNNVILVSIHVNAAGNGSKWRKARGWSVYTTKGNTAADRLADCLCNAAIEYFKDLKIRTDYSDGDPDFEENFYILRHTLCPAVLVENFFYDNQEDLRFLEAEEGKDRIVRVIIEGIREYFSTPPRNNTNSQSPS